MIYEIDFNDLPVIRNVRVPQGDTYREPYEIWLNDEPLDLTGATITVAIRRAPGRGEVVVSRQLYADDAAAGRFIVLVPAADTTAMLGDYYYEVEISWPEGSNAFAEGCTKTVIAGHFVVVEDVLH